MNNELDAALAYVAAQPNALTLTGLNPTHHLTQQDVGQLATYAGALDDLSRWVLADLLVWAEQQTGRTHQGRMDQAYYTKRDAAWRELLKLARRDYHPHTVLQMVQTAKAWPYERRRANVSFEHHRLLNSRPPHEQDEYLDMAEFAELSCSQLREALYQKQLPDPLVVSNRPDWYMGDVGVRLLSNARAVFEAHDVRVTVEARMEHGFPVLHIESEDTP
jgi:hypothetical protein